MITVEEAKQEIYNNVFSLPIIEKNINSSLNYFLAEDIYAPISIPLFNQSAMDGYAFKFDDIKSQMTIVDEVPAGDVRTVNVNKGEAVRIYTGGKVPNDCDTVVMQELTEILNGKLLVKDEGLKLGGNVRVKGNQVKAGDITLNKNTKITPGAVGFLAALGIEKVSVYEMPRVAIIATGSELIKPGNKLVEGQIFESNTYMLDAALQNKNIYPTLTVVKDDLKETQRVIKNALLTNEIVLLSGGISVGDYDFVKESLEENGVKEVFYKIKQKPGKPLFFGKTKDSYVFALPGNPAAALSCFYEYVYPAINIMMGSNHPELIKMKLPINNSYDKKSGRANFLKGITDFKMVTPLEGQGSDALQSFALANCLIFTDIESSRINKGDIVEIHLLP